jgi:phosphoribosylanthranilate isomerase
VDLQLQNTFKRVSITVHHFVAFILNYKKSHRFIDYKTAEILTNIPKLNTSYVGVFVDPTEEELEQYSKLKLDYFQIYGNFNSE